MRSSRLFLLIPLFTFILSGILLTLAIYFQWLGEAREGVMLFCENARPGFIKQPANSFSNLGFTIAGFYMGWFAYEGKINPGSPFYAFKLYPISMSVILVLLGAGSFAMHATNAFAGGFLDLLAMFLISSFFFTYSLKRLLRLSGMAFLGIYVVNIIICSYFFLSSWNHFGFILSVSEFAVTFHIIVAAIAEMYMAKSGLIRIQIQWALLGVISLLIAFLIWNISRTHESLWCNPDSLIQGHAVWHLINAVSITAIFRYYCSESELG